MRYYLINCLVFILLAISNLEARPRLMLSLEQARKHAIDYNKTLVGSGFAMDKSRMALWEAIAHGLPQLSASMDYSNALGAKISIRFAENMPASQIDIKPTNNLYLNVNQLIFSGNYIVGIQMARLSKELSHISHEKTELEVVSQVSDAYYMVLITREMVKILEQNLINLGALYDKTAPLVTVGIIEEMELDQLSVQLASLKNALASAGRQAELAANLLRLHLGVTIDTELELTDRLDGFMDDARVESLVLQQFDLSQNLDYRVITQQERLVDKGLDLQRASALPSLAAFYRYTHKLIEPDFDMTPDNVLGFQLNIPIFSSGLRMARTQQASIDLKSVRNQKDLLSDQLRLQERQLRYNLINAMETYQNQRNSVAVSRRVYQNLQRKYEQGLISGLDLISADNNYLRAESDYVSAMMEVLNARLQLEKLYGTM